MIQLLKYIQQIDVINMTKGLVTIEKYDVIKFVDNDFELDVRTDIKNETVWLTQKEMALLFAVSTDNVGLHIKNIIAENELDDSTTE